MSLCLCPDFAPSLVALANMELLLIENSNLNSNSNQSLIGPISTVIGVKGEDKGMYLFSSIIGDEKETVTAINTEIESNSMCFNSEAYGYAMAAVRARHLDPECWYALGRVYQSFGLLIEAGEAFALSLQALRNDPVRPYGSVLDDSLVMPRQSKLNIGRL